MRTRTPSRSARAGRPLTCRRARPSSSPACTGAATRPRPPLRDQVKFDTPAPGGYQDLVATTLDTSTTTPTAYQGFRDVTGLVAAVGAGDYWVANVQGTAGSTNKHAGWALVVAYRDAASPRQNIAVFDGFQDVKTGDPHSATLTGLTTPASGTVDATVGVFAHEGDLGITGDVLALNATTLSNALNPANNAFNSSITRRGVRLSAKNPDYVNQFSVEMDTFAADAIVPPNATSATVNMTSTQDRYYPGVITYAGEAETVPPVTTIDSGPSGFTNDSTPTYAFSSNEAGSTFECRVDGGAWTSCTSPTHHGLAGRRLPHLRGARDRRGRQHRPDAGDSDDHGRHGRAADDDRQRPVRPDERCDADVRVLGRPGRLDVRVPRRRRRLGLVHARRTRPRRSPTARTPSRCARRIRPATSMRHRPRAASRSTRRRRRRRSTAARPARPTMRRRPSRSRPTRPARRSSAASTPAPGRPAARRRTRPRRSPTARTPSRCARPIRPATSMRLRRRAASRSTRPRRRRRSTAARRPDQRRDADLRVLGQPGRLDVRVPRRRRRLGLLQLAPHTTASLADGAHTFEVRATDPAGNVDATPASRSFTVDTAAPKTTIDSGPSARRTTRRRRSRSRPTRPARRSSAASTPAPGLRARRRTTTASLADGAHTFEVRATDPAGNVDATPASRSFTVDTAAPQTTIDSGPVGPDERRDADLRVLGQPGGLDVRVPRRRRRLGLLHARPTRPRRSRTAPTPSRCARPIRPATSTRLPLRAASRSTRPRRRRRSTAARPARRTTRRRRSRSPPTRRARRSSAGSTAARGLLQLDAHTTASLADGAHTFEVRATDPAGNVDPTPASRSFTVDTAAPQDDDRQRPVRPDERRDADVRVLRRPGGLDVRVPRRRRRLGVLQLDARHDRVARGRRPHLRGARHRPGRQRRPDAGLAQLHGRHGRAADDDRQRPVRPDERRDADVRVLGRPGRLDVRVPGRRRRLGLLRSTPDTTASLADGAHTFEVRATDPAGNVDPTPASRSFTVDTAAPNTTIDSGPSGPTSDATPTFTFSADQAGSTLRVPRRRRRLGLVHDAAHDRLARRRRAHLRGARDRSGRQRRPDARLAQLHGRHGRAADTTIDSGPSGPTNDATPTFAFSADQAGSTLRVPRRRRRLGLVLDARRPPARWPTAHTPSRCARPTRPATSTRRPASRSFTVDTAAPETTIDSGPSGPTSDATPTFAFSADQAGSTLRVPRRRRRLGLVLDARDHRVAGRRRPHLRGARDGPGRQRRPDAGLAQLHGRHGRAAARRSTAAPRARRATRRRPSRSRPTRPGSTFECRVDGGAWGSCSTPETTGSLADGAHTFEVRATDPAGNVDPTPASRSFTVDTAAPDTTIDSGPSGPTNDATPTFAFSADQAGSTLRVPRRRRRLGLLLDARDDRLARRRRAHLRGARDRSGRQRRSDAGLAQLHGRHGRAATPRSTAAPRARRTTRRRPSPSRPTRPARRFECRVDGGAWGSCSTPETTALAGRRRAHLRGARDRPGRQRRPDAGLAQLHGRHGRAGHDDRQRPLGPDERRDADLRLLGRPGRLDASSAASTAAPGAPAARPETTASLADGAHTFEVRATDPAGNVDPTPASRTFTVDTAAPNTTIDSGPSGPTNDATPTFAFSADQAGLDVRVPRRRRRLGLRARRRRPPPRWPTAPTPSRCARPTRPATSTRRPRRAASRSTRPRPTPRSTAARRAPRATRRRRSASRQTRPARPSSAGSTAARGLRARRPRPPRRWRTARTPSRCARPTRPGNVDPTPASRSFTVDTAAPNTTIDSGPSGPTNDATPTFAFSADQPGSTFECRVDGGAWACLQLAPHHRRRSRTAPHTFEVRATDPAGNVDADSRVAQPSPSTPARPNTTIDSGPSGTTNDATPTLRVLRRTSRARRSSAASTAAPGLPAPRPTRPPRSPTAPTPSRCARPTSAGNVDPTPASRSFTVDTAVPKADPPAETPSNPPPNITPSEITPPPTSDLGALPGSLVGERSCQRLGAGLRTKRDEGPRHRARDRAHAGQRHRDGGRSDHGRRHRPADRQGPTAFSRLHA